jgi:proline iminopeptidase
MSNITDNYFMIIQDSVYELKFTLDQILFPKLEAYNEGYLRVSELHEIWYSEYGNPSGKPVVFLHGGPGGGCSPDSARFFDPEHYRIILFDQRGCGRSKPFGEVEGNTTQDLIEDIENLREHLKIDKWLIFGGSWGSALAMTYGEAYPNSCLGFILRGIFLGKESEFQQVWYGMKDIFPEVWDEFSCFLPLNERRDLIKSYYKRLMDPNAEIHMAAARAFIKYDFTASFLLPNAQIIEQILKNDILVLGCARLFAHYSMHKFFFEENQILDNLAKIKHLPAIIVHGRYDVILRVSSAYELHKNWSGSEFILVPDAGHSSVDHGIAKALVVATEKLKN